MWPHFITYTDKLPTGVGGQARGPLIQLRPKYRDDQGILQHELEHVRQWWVINLAAALLIVALALLIDTSLPMSLALGVFGFLAHSLMYLAIRPYRQWAEVRAYQVQMRYPSASGQPMSASDAAWRLLSSRYQLNLDLASALALINKES